MKKTAFAAAAVALLQWPPHAPTRQTTLKQRKPLRKNRKGRG